MNPYVICRSLIVSLWYGFTMSLPKVWVLFLFLNTWYLTCQKWFTTLTCPWWKTKWRATWKCSWEVNILVFCYQNCSDLLWEKIVLVIEKTFEIQGWRPRICKITRTIYSNSERSEQFLVTECFFNLFLEVSQI